MSAKAQKYREYCNKRNSSFAIPNLEEELYKIAVMPIIDLAEYTMKLLSEKYVYAEAKIAPEENTGTKEIKKSQRKRK